jgi:hypothetical protein
MSTRDEEIERLVREATAKEPVPEFERIWRRATARAGKRGFRGGAWQWALGPMLAAVSAAIVIIAVRGVPIVDTPVAPVASVASGVQEANGPLVAVADAGAGTSTARAEDAEQAESKPDAEGLYVAGTDFLLEMDIPAWN